MRRRRRSGLVPPSHAAKEPVIKPRVDLAPPNAPPPRAEPRTALATAGQQAAQTNKTSTPRGGGGSHGCARSAGNRGTTARGRPRGGGGVAAPQ